MSFLITNGWRGRRRRRKRFNSPEKIIDDLVLYLRWRNARLSKDLARRHSLSRFSSASADRRFSISQNRRSLVDVTCFFLLFFHSFSNRSRIEKKESKQNRRFVQEKRTEWKTSNCSRCHCNKLSMWYFSGVRVQVVVELEALSADDLALRRFSSSSSSSSLLGKLEFFFVVSPRIFCFLRYFARRFLNQT